MVVEDFPLIRKGWMVIAVIIYMATNRFEDQIESNIFNSSEKEKIKMKVHGIKY